MRWVVEISNGAIIIGSRIRLSSETRVNYLGMEVVIPAGAVGTVRSIMKEPEFTWYVCEWQAGIVCVPEKYVKPA